MKTLGDRIRHARTLRGLSQSELGKVLGVSREAVSLWEKGKNAPTLDKIGPIAKVTGVPAEWLLKGGHLDPTTRKPADFVDDELTEFVAGLQGKARRKALAMLKTLMDDEENEPSTSQKVA